MIILCISYSRIFWNIIKNYETLTEISSIKIFVNNKEKKITFKIKVWYYLDLLTPETMKLLGNTKSKITKYKNGENLPHLEIEH